MLDGTDADPIEVEFRIKYVVQNQQKQSRGTAIKTLKLRKIQDSLEIVSVREKALK